MSGMFGCSREAIRVKVRKCESNEPIEFRKFSVDPQITSFEVLQSILMKAFDLKNDFTICYRVIDVSGNETYMPLLSDWELDAAFLKAYNTSVANNLEPCLSLEVNVNRFEESPEDWEHKQNVSFYRKIRTSSSQEVKSSPRLHGIFNQMGKTFNTIQRVLNFGEDGNTLFVHPPRPPLSDTEFRSFLDPVGQIIHAKELRSVIYYGGIDPSLRKVVWKHLLNVYPEGMTGRERMDYIKKKAGEYVGLRDTWKKAVANGPVVGELAYTTGMVRKDVLRTDRHHAFYAGSDDNSNVASLFNILTTYALNHPKVSYCQGMSDLASPLLVTMNDEAHAYICFCALMRRLATNFMIDGIAMTQKFTHLAEGLMYYDPKFYDYLKIHQADDLLFCYRWLLLEMKREFAFDDSLRMLEVLWSSLPADLPKDELPLYDVLFDPTPLTTTPPVSPLVKTPRESAYTKVCALRRQSSSISICTHKSDTVRRQNHSLDETTTSHLRQPIGIRSKYQSLDDTTLFRSHQKESNGDLRPRSVSPLEPPQDCVIINNRINTQKSSSLSNLKKNGGLRDKMRPTQLFSSLDCLDTTIKEEMEIKPKLVKNLNEFLNFVNKPKIVFTEEGNNEKSDERILLESDVKTIVKRNDDIFVWENPLHESSSNLIKNCLGKPTEKLDEVTKEEVHACEEVTESVRNSALLPPPDEFGGGNPFLMFLCLTVLLQHREHIISLNMDYNEMAMHFDKMVRQHNVNRVLNQAREMYACYMKQHMMARHGLHESQNIERI